MKKIKLPDQYLVEWKMIVFCDNMACNCKHKAIEVAEKDLKKVYKFIIIKCPDCGKRIEVSPLEIPESIQLRLRCE